jgi:membrane fusion protein (multidrug efflux system)
MIFNNIRLIPVVMLTCLLLGGCQQESKKAVMAAPGPVEVDVVTVTPQVAELAVELPGRTAAFRVAEVRPQVNGIIKQRLFVEGSEVTAGQLLYQIDPAVYQAKVDSADASLARARAVEHSTKLKAERYKVLVKTKAVSELDQIEIEATWKQAVADVASAEAALNSARIDLNYTRVTAPISGRIGKTMISEGALVTAQQSTALATIQQLDPLYVDVTQSSMDLLKLKKDLSSGAVAGDTDMRREVAIILEDGSQYAETGSLEFSDVTVDQTTGGITLRAIVANPRGDLLPGMFVRANIVSGMKADAILIPALSVSRNVKGQAVVMVVNDESNVEARIIESGRNIGDKVMVNAGLKGGEKVIVAGLQKVKPGVAVHAIEQQTPVVGMVTGQAQETQPVAHVE